MFSVALFVFSPIDAHSLYIRGVNSFSYVPHIFAPFYNLLFNFVSGVIEAGGLKRGSNQTVLHLESSVPQHREAWREDTDRQQGPSWGSAGDCTALGNGW